MSKGEPPPWRLYSVTVPVAEILATLSALDSTNHMFSKSKPSYPVQIRPRPAPLGTLYSVITPPSVMLPIFPVLVSVNHSGGPVSQSMPTGPELGVGMVYSVMTPAVVMKPILLALNSVSQEPPAGPAMIPRRPEL